MPGPFQDDRLLAFTGGILAFLSLASLVSFTLRRTRDPEGRNAVLQNLAARIRAWWAMILVFMAATAAGPTGTCVLFALVSFVALREYLTLTPTLRADHRPLALALFVVVPGQYLMVGLGLMGLFAILIPVWVFILLPIRQALAGETTAFLERSAKVQWGLMVCVYFVSHVPALLRLPLPGHDGGQPGLLLFLVTVVQASDVLQYVWGKLLGRRKLIPTLSPSKTVEGFLGGVASATALGAGLWWMTPCRPAAAALLALVVCLMGFFGGVVMSAIKRDRGIKDFGDLLPGHGGMLDRIDSLCFAAPAFYHLIRYFYGG